MQPGITLKKDLDGLGAYVDQIDRILRRHVEFGNPAHPLDPASTTLAGDMTATDMHNGALDNIYGSWVEVQIDDEQEGNNLDSPVQCWHNLDITPIAGPPVELNVRWLEFGYTHSGAGAGATSTISVNYEAGDAITNNYIELRFYANARTVDVGNPLKATLYFIPAVRG